jgi:threonine aldolase
MSEEVRQHFESDYLEGAHPLILQRLIETNMEKTPGYGLDAYCDAARQKIRSACHCPQAEVFFLVGGTQTNATVIDGLLRPYQGVVSAESGHISTHEAGAIEFGGHKVLTLPHTYGKLNPRDVERCFMNYDKDVNKDHVVMPGMVYISHPTEYGTLYTKAELEQLSGICRRFAVPLFLDGARLGYGLTAEGTDVTLEVIAETCDVFYIGGTKVGALFGEAVVITRQGLIPHFFSIVKQHGALLAKGRMLGIQFDTLFSDGLYFNIAGHAIDMAKKLKAGFLQKGYRLFFDSPTNQQFIILENKQMECLARQVCFSVWEPYDETHTVVRFATSWATKEEDVQKMLELL